MKHNNSNIGKQAEDALNSLEGIRRASPQPFFYTRLRARIGREDNRWAGIIRFISRPAFAAAIIGGVLFLNAWILYRNNEKMVISSSSSGHTPSINVDIAEDYRLAANTFYDYETTP